MSSHYCSQNLVLVMEEMGSSGNLPKGIGTGLSAPYESTEARLYVASVLKQPGRARSCGLNSFVSAQWQWEGISSLR